MVHILNRSPTASLTGKTPHEAWHKKKPDVSHLRVWGCLAYVHTQGDKRKPFGSHMEKCIFIGYPAGYKGWQDEDNEDEDNQDDNENNDNQDATTASSACRVASGMMAPMTSGRNDSNQ